MPTMRRADVSCSTTPAARQATLHTLFLPTNREVDAALWSDAPANAERWAHLRSWRRYLPDGTVFVVLRSGLGLVVGVNTVYAIAVCAYFTWLVPLGAPDWPDDVSRAAVAPIAALNLVSFALAFFPMTSQGEIDQLRRASSEGVVVLGSSQRGGGGKSPFVWPGWGHSRHPFCRRRRLHRRRAHAVARARERGRPRPSADSGSTRSLHTPPVTMCRGPPPCHAW